MPSPFDALDAAASGAVVAAFGEATATLTPRIVNQYRGPIPDPARPAREVAGVYSEAPENELFEGQRRISRIDSMTSFNVADPEFWMTAAQAVALGYRPAAGDLLTVAAGAFNVAAVMTTDMGDIVLRLTREDQAI